MLGEIRVSNYALIDELSLKLGPGLNVLSGETGAGKSIVIGAINLLLGERALTEQIRGEEENAFVEGIFEHPESFLPEIRVLLGEAGIECGETLIIAREITRGGRSIGRVNGRAVPVYFLKKLGELLVDLHGQHEHQLLLRPDYQRELLDLYGGDEIAGVRKAVEKFFGRQQELQKRFSELGLDCAERERRIEILSFQIRTILEARLEPGEEEKLLKEEKILAHVEKLKGLVVDVYSKIYQGDEHRAASAAVDLLAVSKVSLEEAAKIDPELDPLVNMIEGASAQLEELSFTLRDYLATFEYDSAELSTVQKRLEQLHDLKRRFGNTVAEVIAFGQQAEEELDRLRNSESLAQELEIKIKQNLQQLEEACNRLNELRYQVAALLEPLLEDRFYELALPRARFGISITRQDRISLHGRDRVEFLFSANPGEELRSLTKIISGGEMSRVMLAIKTIFAGQERIPTLIFDEIDAGIGGSSIQAVAEKLSLLALHHQIICVTHSPQIAAMADCHIRLHKVSSEESTQTRAKLLGHEERRAEIARMLDGAVINQVSLRHVDSLLGRAAQFKKNVLTEKKNY